jgi:excisionase family DNA binding protein
MKGENKMVKVLSPEQVSSMLEVKISTIYQWTHQRFIPHIKIGRFVRFKEDEIEKWLAENQKKVLGKVEFEL